MGNFFLQHCWQYNLPVQQNKLTKVYFCKLWFFNFFWKWAGKAFEVLQNSSSRFFRTVFYVSRETFWGKTRLWKQICYGFSNLSGQLESIQGNVSNKMLKVQSTCQDEQFEEIYFSLEKNIFRIIFGTWTENCRTFEANSSAWSSKCTVHLPRMTLQRMYRF